MKSVITRKEAQAIVKIDEHCQIVGNFLVNYGNPILDIYAATVHLIEGCKYSIDEVAEIIRDNFPDTSSIKVQDQPWLDEKYIDLEWDDMEYEWDNHEIEFQKRVLDPLELLSVN